eukprot:8534249-Pyramimonas_sp.AAC.1
MSHPLATITPTHNTTTTQTTPATTISKPPQQQPCHVMHHRLKWKNVGFIGYGDPHAQLGNA